jgi:DNA-binding transcriptional ArsR family regulator
MARGPSKFVIRRAEQLVALASPVRCRIVDALSASGPSSVRQIAARLGRKPESLYYHIRALVDVGLVVSREKRRVGRRAEAVYQLVAPRLIIDPKQRTAAYADALAGTCAALLRLTARNYRAAIDRGDFVLDGARRNLMVRRCIARLDRAGLARLNRYLEGIGDLAEKREAGQTIALTVVLTQLAD